MAIVAVDKGFFRWTHLMWPAVVIMRWRWVVITVVGEGNRLLTVWLASFIRLTSIWSSSAIAELFGSSGMGSLVGIVGGAFCDCCCCNFCFSSSDTDESSTLILDLSISSASTLSKEIKLNYSDRFRTEDGGAYIFKSLHMAACRRSTENR